MVAMVVILDPNGMFLAILNLHVALMSPTRIQFSQTDGVMIFKMTAKEFHDGSHCDYLGYWKGTK